MEDQHRYRLLRNSKNHTEYLVEVADPVPEGVLPLFRFSGSIVQVADYFVWERKKNPGTPWDVKGFSPTLDQALQDILNIVRHKSMPSSRLWLN